MATGTWHTKLKDRYELHLEWLLPTVLHPKKTIQTLVEQDKPVWLTPLALLSILTIIAGLVAGPIRRLAVVNAANLPADFSYYSTDQQAQLMSAQATQSSGLFTFLFPMLESLIGIWLLWFLLSSLLHLSLTLSGSRASSFHSYNLVAWCMLPLAVRQLVQIFAMLFSQSLINANGLSGFIAADASGGMAYLAGILGQVDVYFFWMIALLLIGVVPLSGLTRTKAWTATGVSLLILVLLAAVPHLASSLLSGLSSAGSFF